MLLHDDVVSDGKAKTGALASGFCRKERIEHLFLHLGRNAGAVVAYPNLNFVAEVFRRRRKSRLITISIIMLFALGRRVEAVDGALSLLKPF